LQGTTNHVEFGSLAGDALRQELQTKGWKLSAGVKLATSKHFQQLMHNLPNKLSIFNAFYPWYPPLH
jgi:hypothetical protein